MDGKTGGVLNPAFHLGDEIIEKKKQAKVNAVPVVEKIEPEIEIADCGLQCFKLRVFNGLRSPKWCLVFLSLAACVQGLCVNGLVNVVITSIERRFGLKSTQSGTIASFYDVGNLLIIIPVTYLGGRVGASKPRWIAGGLVFMGLGSLVWTLPHFLTGPYSATGGESPVGVGEILCGTEEEDLPCLRESGEGIGLYQYFYVFLLGQLLHGVGSAPLVTLGTTFLDDSVSKHSSPLYIGVFQTWFVLGPALGFVVGGQLLSLHTDLTQKDSKLTPASSLWVGAWWPGFLITFLCSFCCACCLCLYPAHINRKVAGGVVDRKSSPNIVTGLLGNLVSLLSNPTFMFVSLGGAVDGVIVSGLAAFLPKFIEHQYQLSNGLAAQVVGLLVVPAGGGGTFLGGWLVKRFNLSRDGIIFFCFLTQVITLPFILLYLLSCPSPSYVGLANEHHSPLLVGLTAPPEEHHSHLLVGLSALPEDRHSHKLSNILQAPRAEPSSPFLDICNTNCSCPTDRFDPVCGSDSLMYLSPCLAGCSSNSNSTSFSECVCIDGGGTANRTICSNNCQYFIPYLVLQFLMIFLAFLDMPPLVVASLRAVHTDQSSLALGVQTVFSRLLGTIPGPVLFGFFIDRTCMLWEPSCGDVGSCLVYDNSMMSTTILAICMICKIIVVFFFGLGYVCSKKSTISDDKTEVGGPGGGEGVERSS